VNRELAKKVADAVLYEGYMLYPYRPSALKNRQRWSFGILYPPAYDEVRAGTERAQMHSEVLVRTPGRASVTVQLRFLHLRKRQLFASVNNERTPVQSLDVYGSVIESCETGVERLVDAEMQVANGRSSADDFSFPAETGSEPIDYTGEVLGEIEESQEEVAGTVKMSCARIGPDVFKLAIDVANQSTLPPEGTSRDHALSCSLVSAHLILTVERGEFVSVLDPPDELQDAVRGCSNIGNFPVLVGNEGERDMMLCSPILLYDYPQIAPESAGDFFDGTEMDEMLTLRVMTLTDAEKSEVRAGDAHARNLLERTEQAAREQLQRTHGTIRSLRPLGGTHD
jgi:hypothetical protein